MHSTLHKKYKLSQAIPTAVFRVNKCIWPKYKHGATCNVQNKIKLFSSVYKRLQQCFLYINLLGLNMCLVQREHWS